MNEPVMLFSRSDIRSLLSIEECIVAVEEALRAYGLGRAAKPGTLGIHADGGVFHIKAGILSGVRPFFVAKVNGNFPGNRSTNGRPTVQGLIVLSDSTNGTPLAVFDTAEITSLRTAAATGVAAKVLARTDSRTLGIVGCGLQGRMSAVAVAAVRPITRVRFFDLDEASARRCADDISGRLDVDVSVVGTAREAVVGTDICVTCTTARTAFLSPSWVSPGMFIAAVGADNHEKQEIDPSVLARSTVVTDVTEQCAAMGDLYHAIQAGVMATSDVHAELGEVVAGQKAGRRTDDDVIVFDSTGMALQDAAACGVVYEKGRLRSVRTLAFAE